MTTAETYLLHGLCLRLIHAIAPERPEAPILARWIASRPDLFGTVPPVPAGRRRKGVEAQGWQALGAHIAGRLQEPPPDRALDRLGTIAAHLGLSGEEEAILHILALLQRKGPLAGFAAMLSREIGLSDEAVLGWCCNLDEAAVWTALAPQGRLVTLGLVRTDAASPVPRDEAYALSGLFLVLIQPPGPHLAEGHLIR